MKTIVAFFIFAFGAHAKVPWPQAYEIIRNTFTVTAYCNNYGKGCAVCCGKWAKYHKTASGHVPKQGITCAASHNMSFGTVLFIRGVGERIVQDRLSPKYDNRIDIYFDDHRNALKFGIKKLNVYVKRSQSNSKSK